MRKGVATSFYPAAIQLSLAALMILGAVIWPEPALRAQQPIVSPTIDFKWQTEEVPIKDSSGVDWSGSTFCALTNVEFLGGRGSYGACNVRRDSKMGWVISTGINKYVQKCSVTVSYTHLTLPTKRIV